MRIALDAMGGDHAPAEVVKGAIEGARENGVGVVLVGPTAIVRAELEKHAPVEPHLEVMEAPEVVTMDEAPAMAVRQKRNSSLAVGMKLVKAGEASAFISAGNSGAVMAAALLILGMEEGVERPALATVFPTPAGPVLFLDVGANTDCKASFLLQFAQMGDAYMKKVFSIARPRIGLVSNGEEESKGNQLVREAHALLRKSGLNFVGNVEGKDVARGVADVVVTDGFTGNVMVKVTEGVHEMLAAMLEQESERGAHMALAVSLLRPLLQSVMKRLDYTEYGGALLLGVKGNVIIGHGRSDARAIKSALRLAKRMVEQEEGTSSADPLPNGEGEDTSEYHMHWP